MKKTLLAIALVVSGFAFAQEGKLFWKATPEKSGILTFKDRETLPSKHLYNLDIPSLKAELAKAPLRGTVKSSVIVYFPNAEGTLERFRIVEAPVMDPELTARYPEIRSYAGQGIDDPTAIIRFSVSPLGLQTMMTAADRPSVFIEPYSTDLKTYSVYKRTQKSPPFTKFECEVADHARRQIAATDLEQRPNADDGKLRTYRLAMSVTGEYTAYYGGTKALALAAINTTMTRVNGVFEKDFGVNMVLISNTDAVIYTSAASDPYGSTDANYNSELQSTLTSVIGNANYDVGHLMSAIGNNGNAGCIGCVCASGKGSGFTTSTAPVGDNFDIDFVAHEMGHQFGANHTFTFSNEGSGVQNEPGSGTTIMGYAGITGATDVQPHSDPFFHAVSIQQVTNYVKTTTCQTNTTTGNAIPTANAGLDYTIPKGTPFMLTGSGTDANDSGLTYCWEQMNSGTTSTTYPSVTATSGPAFRSYVPTTGGSRVFPRMATIKTGATSWQWEAVPNVARTLNFRLTVRDNHAGGPANNSDDMVVTVNATAGPFTVSAPNTAVSWAAGSTQTVTWNVAGTTANGVNAANVDILLSTDGGDTYPITILSGTPNDGTQTITVPNNPGTTNRIMVKGSNHIFFDISNANFTITASGGGDATPPSTPLNLVASGTTQTTTNLSWSASTDNIAVTGYDVYQGATLKANVTGTTYTVTELTAATAYTFSVKAKDAAGNSSAASNTVSVTTLAATGTYCASAGTTVSDEYIGRVQLGTINNASAGGAGGYTDFTSLSTNLNKSTAYTIMVTPTWTGTAYAEGYAVWIDYNGDKDFDDSGELVWSKAAATTAPATGSFTVPATAATGATRMRVSMKYNGVPTACETFSYGEVEDYTVNIQAGSADTTAPTAPTLTASGTTQTTTNLSWTGATDNVAVTGYDVYQGATIITSVTGTTYTVTGLTAATAYSFSVKAKDAAGNISVASNMVNVTTLSNTLTYCTSKGNSVSDEYINRVQFGTINNLSGANAGYGNFTSLSTSVSKGSAYTITITPAWTGSTYNEGYAVWIDYNADGDFSDSGELVWSKAASTTTPVSGSITIPSTASTGATRMRVSMKYNAIPTACEAFSYGEVEDYTVVIGSSARAAESSTVAITLYPNPSENVLNITNISEKAAYTIYTIAGQEAGKGIPVNGVVDVSRLAAGSYLIEINDNGTRSMLRFIKK
ncbi:secretion protein [Flavobacterium album]|uniref:Secretion protein n=1 Tax=Flavobacterium album TaxID=2175091 RepID=A0A2S1QVF7_9FLAO|nr:GEVED domain-containing protein [Flavobacterium album]AWH84201.1 secretion protein [Flavobacterium album]